MTIRKILLAGYWKHGIYEEAIASGLSRAGVEVIPLKLMQKSPTGSRLLNSFANRINDSKSLEEAVRKTNPNCIFLHKPESLKPSTLARLRKEFPRIPILAYHNDNPYVNRIRYLSYLRLLHYVHHVFYYRPSDSVHIAKYTSASTSLLMPSYITYEHYPDPSEAEHYHSDVIFIGHWESDQRDVYVKYLLDNDISIRVLGTRWQSSRVLPYDFTRSIHPVYGAEYRRFLSSAKIALVFLSSSNRDVYTRRCFEIPACSTLMVTPRNRYISSLFKEGEEVEYFQSKQELLNVVRSNLHNSSKRERLANNCFNRVRKEMHNEIGRARSIISIAEVLREKLCGEY